MELCMVQVGFPVFRYKTRISYTTSRSNTAFETVLLNLIDRFGANERYRAIPLERIFEDILGVFDPLPFIEISLVDLVRLDLVRSEFGLHTVGKITLGNLTLTDLGVRMLSGGVESAVSQRQQEMFEYDPIRGKLLSHSAAGGHSSQRPSIAVDAAVFEESFPSELIRQAIQDSGYRWWTPQSKLESVERVSTDVVWIECSAAIVSKSGSLLLNCDDPAHTSYLNSLPEKQRLDSIVRPAIFDDRLSSARLQRLPVGDPENSHHGEWITFPQVLTQFAQGGTFWLVNTRLDLFDLPESAPKGCALLCFDDKFDDSAVKVIWNQMKDGCFVFVGMEFPVPEGCLIRGNQVHAARRIKLSLGQSVFEAAVFNRYVTDVSSQQISDSLARVTQLIASSDSKDDIPAMAFWLSARDYWSMHKRYFQNESANLVELTQLMLSARDNCLRVTESADQGPWEESLASLFSVAAVKCRQMPTNDLSVLFSNLAICEITSPAAIASLVDSLAMCLPPLPTPREFSLACDSIRTLGRDWIIPFPSRLYSDEFIAEVIHRFDSEEIKRCMVNKNDFDQTISELASTYHSMKDQLGTEAIKLLESSASPSGVALKGASFEQLLDTARTWQECFAALGNVCPLLPRYLVGSRLATVKRVVDGISDGKQALLPGLNRRLRSIYVFDTSALLNRPEILDTIALDEYVVVAKRVLEELDDKKMDENLRPDVAKVIRALMNFPKERIEFCQGDMSLLPMDYRLKGDNLILSVAVRYRDAGVTLVTNDKNLSLKAREEGIGVMSADQFAERGFTRSGRDVTEKKSTTTRMPRVPRRDK